ncbi:MAG: hypothetical protein ACRC46_04565 [Thermoguttaceae bacterium]
MSQCVTTIRRFWRSPRSGKGFQEAYDASASAYSLASETETRDLAELLRDDKLILNAIRLGSLEAMKRHIAGGVPMVSMKDGEIVYIQPDELKRILALCTKEN